MSKCSHCGYESLVCPHCGSTKPPYYAPGDKSVLGRYGCLECDRWWSALELRSSFRPTEKVVRG